MICELGYIMMSSSVNNQHVISQIFLGFSYNRKFALQTQSYNSQRLGSDCWAVTVSTALSARFSDKLDRFSPWLHVKWQVGKHQSSGIHRLLSELWKVSAHAITHIMGVLRRAAPLSVYLFPFCLFCPPCPWILLLVQYWMIVNSSRTWCLNGKKLKVYS